MPSETTDSAPVSTPATDERIAAPEPSAPASEPATPRAPGGRRLIIIAAVALFVLIVAIPRVFHKMRTVSRTAMLSGTRSRSTFPHPAAHAAARQITINQGNETPLNVTPETLECFDGLQKVPHFVSAALEVCVQQLTTQAASGTFRLGQVYVPTDPRAVVTVTLTPVSPKVPEATPRPALLPPTASAPTGFATWLPLGLVVLAAIFGLFALKRGGQR
jgi:hypothetical protein